MTEGRRQVRALCAAVREALREVERVGMLSDDAPDAHLSTVERWTEGEADDTELREALAASRARVEAQDRGEPGEPVMIALTRAVDCALRAAQDVAWDARAQLPRDAVFFWVEATLELAGERAEEALARSTLAWDAALRRTP